MDKLKEKFEKLGVENAPGQEVQKDSETIGTTPFDGQLVDFSHGDVDAHQPIPGSLEMFHEAYEIGSSQAYTEYKGDLNIRKELAEKLSGFMDAEIDAKDQLIVTPGTQGALFLALGSCVTKDIKVATVEPDYFANRKLVEFFEGEYDPIDMDYKSNNDCAGINLEKLEESFQNGAEVFLFSNPNNPTGVVYSEAEIEKIADLSNKYDVTVIADELYSRQIFDNRRFVHICNKNNKFENLVTIIGPSKTESLSGFRLGVAFGSNEIIQRMEKLLAIVSLRASGYNQYVLKKWFSEPQNWIKKRIASHQEIRDEIVNKFRSSGKVKVRKTEAGSYLFPEISDLTVSIDEFINQLRIKANVIVTPGTEFGPQFKKSFRINFSQDKHKALDATDRIIKMIGEFEKNEQYP